MHLVDVSERYRHAERMAHLADHDPLTGLVNRRRFEADLRVHLEDGEGDPEGALLMLDLDNFKEVNDSLGHHVGDQLIVAVATLLRQGACAGDLVARIGGDEFAHPAADGRRGRCPVRGAGRPGAGARPRPVARGRAAPGVGEHRRGA